MSISTSGRPSRPILRYHGGKFKLRDWIVPQLEQLPHLCYVEPYAGAASVLMGKQRVYAEVVNDLDDEVVNVFAVLRDPDQAHALRRALELTPYARAEYVQAYQPTPDPVERARRTIFRATAGIGTDSVMCQRGFRNSTKRSKQRITVAWDWASFPAQVPLFVERLRGVVIEHRPALDVIAAHDSPASLYYVDPPYLVATRTGNGHYAHEMSEADHVALAEALHTVQGQVVLSGYASPLYAELYAGWATAQRLAFAHGAEPRTEVLYFSPNAQTRRLALL